MWDERFSTEGIQREMLNNGLKKENIKKHIDCASATWVLQGVLDRINYNNYDYENKHLLSIKDLSVKDIEGILNDANKFLNKKSKKFSTKKIKGKNIINLFLKTLQEH